MSAKVRENPPAERLYAIKWRVFAVMMIAWFMSMLDMSIMNTALPELQHDFETDLPNASWVVNVYSIVFAVLLIATGRLADQFGRKKMFIGGLVVFTVGSALCAAAWDIGWLIGFRALQAIGAGMLAPLGFAMTALVFPPRERGKGLAMIAVVALVANGLGPVIGGGLIEIASWHWIFVINLPLGVIGVVLAWRWWPETYDLSANRHIDWLGMVLLGAAVSLFTYGLVEANVRGWDDAAILFFIQISIVLGIGFVIWQKRARNPMIPPALLANKQFLSANLAMVILGAGAVGGLFLLGRHVAEGAGKAAAVAPPFAGHVRQAEVDDLQVEVARVGGAGEQQVLGFQIAMDDAEPMGFVEPREHRPHDARRHRQRHVLPALLLGDEPRAERSALHVLHREVGLALPLRDVVHRHHVAMADVLARGALVDEPLHVRLAPEAVGSDQLQRQLTAGGRVAGQVHRAHPALPDEGDDLVAVGERRSRGQRVGSGRTLLGHRHDRGEVVHGSAGGRRLGDARPGGRRAGLRAAVPAEARAVSQRRATSCTGHRRNLGSPALISRAPACG